MEMPINTTTTLIIVVIIILALSAILYFFVYIPITQGGDYGALLACCAKFAPVCKNYNIQCSEQYTVGDLQSRLGYTEQQVNRTCGCAG